MQPERTKLALQHSLDQGFAASCRSQGAAIILPLSWRQSPARGSERLPIDALIFHDLRLLALASSWAGLSVHAARAFG